MQNQSSWRTQTSLRGDRDVFQLSLNYFKAKWYKNKTLWIQTWHIFIFGERTLCSCCEVLTVSSLALIFLSLPHLNTPSVLSFMLLYSSVVFLRISRVWGGSPVLSERIREFPERLWRCNSRWNLRNYSANAGLAPRLSNPLVWHCFSLSRFKSLTLSPKAEAHSQLLEARESFKMKTSCACFPALFTSLQILLLLPILKDQLGPPSEFN